MHFSNLSLSHMKPNFPTYREHNDVTMAALEETMDLVEEEIKAARIKFEEDIKKLTDMLENPAEVIFAKSRNIVFVF